MSFTISSSINATALSARHAAPGSNNVRARAFVRAQPKKSVATFSVCADDAFAARVAAAKATKLKYNAESDYRFEAQGGVRMPANPLDGFSTEPSFGSAGGLGKPFGS